LADKALATGLALLAAVGISACSQPEDRDTSADGGQREGIVGSTIAAFKRDSQPGAALVRKKCASCHYLDRNLAKVGPSLKGIYGRAPTISGVPFKKWDEAALDQWLENPSKVKPGTMMAIPGVKSGEQRAAIIAYLKQI